MTNFAKWKLKSHLKPMSIPSVKQNIFGRFFKIVVAVFPLSLCLGSTIATLSAEERPPGSDLSVKPPPRAVYPLDAVQVQQGATYVVDRRLPGIWQVESGDASIYVEGPQNYLKPLASARCITADAEGNLYVGDPATREVYRIGSDKQPVPLAGGRIGGAYDLAIDGDGTLYVADLERRAIWKIPNAPQSNDQDTEPTIWIPAANARGIAVDDQGRVWAVSQNTQQLVRYDAEGTETVIVDQRVFNFPHQVALSADGTAYVSDGYGRGLWKVIEGQPPEKILESDQLINPVGLAWIDDQLVITDPRTASLWRSNIPRGGPTPENVTLEKSVEVRLK